MSDKIKLNPAVFLAIAIFIINSTIFSFLIYPKIEKGIDLNFDGEGYQKIALNILSGKGFYFSEGDDPVLSSHGRPTLLRPPLYPYFISCVYYIFGFKPQIIVVCHVIINSLMIYFVYRIAKEVFNEKTAILSSFICAFYLPFIWFLPRLYNENIFNFLLACSMFYVVLVFCNLSLINSIILGILIGLASLCKGQMILFPFVLLPGLIYRYRGEKTKFCKHYAIILLTFLLSLSPWVIRNYIVSEKFVPTQFGGAIHFMRGNESAKINLGFFHQNHGIAMKKAFEKEGQIIEKFESLNKRKITEVELDEIFNKIAFNYIKENPIEFLEKIRIGCLHFWYLGESKIKSMGMALLQFPVLMLALLGFYLALKKRIKCIFPLYSVILYFTLVHAAILPISRYSIPIMPYIIMFASFGIITLYNKLKEILQSDLV